MLAGLLFEQIHACFKCCRNAVALGIHLVSLELCERFGIIYWALQTLFCGYEQLLILAWGIPLALFHDSSPAVSSL